MNNALPYLLIATLALAGLLIYLFIKDRSRQSSARRRRKLNIAKADWMLWAMLIAFAVPILLAIVSGRIGV